MGDYCFSINNVLRRSIILYYSRDGGIRGETKELFMTRTTKRLV